MSIEYVRQIKLDWMYDCKYIDELKDGEIGYTIAWCFVALPDKSIVIPRDEFCSKEKRGTHDVKIIRYADEIEVLTNNFERYTEKWRFEKVVNGQPTFPVRFTDNG